MNVPRQAEMKNKLLAILPPADFDDLVPHLEYVALPRGTVVAERQEPFEHVYFLTGGIASVIATTSEGHRAEAGIFGYEGYVPTAAVAGVDRSTHHISIQFDGEAYRMSYDDFQKAMGRNRSLWKVVIRSIEAFSAQLAYTSASNAIHDIDVRLARWLLMCNDRIPGNELTITHDVLSMMLACRRPSVTTALHVLEGMKLIRSERSQVVILDRSGMEAFAFDAYGRPEKDYQRLMSGLF